MRALLFTFLLSGLFSQVLHSQSQVGGRRDLRFGTLFPGIPERVLPRFRRLEDKPLRLDRVTNLSIRVASAICCSGWKVVAPVGAG